MAKIGLSNFRYSKLTEQDGKAVYDGAKTPAKAVSCKVSVTNNDATLYADDVLAESDYSFSSATVTIEIDEDDPQTMADLLGHKLTTDTGGTGNEIVRNSGDTAPYVGLGRVITKMVNGVYKYKVEFLCKVKFSEPSQEEKTKGDKVDFTTTELEGVASSLASGEWSRAKTFDTKEEAITYLEGLMTNTGA